MSTGRLPHRCVADRFSRGHRADVGCPVHERVESARPLQPPQRADTRHLRYERQTSNTKVKNDLIASLFSFQNSYSQNWCHKHKLKYLLLR